MANYTKKLGIEIDISDAKKEFRKLESLGEKIVKKRNDAFGKSKDGFIESFASFKDISQKIFENTKKSFDSLEIDEETKKQLAEFQENIADKTDSQLKNERAIVKLEQTLQKLKEGDSFLNKKAIEATEQQIEGLQKIVDLQEEARKSKAKTLSENEKFKGDRKDLWKGFGGDLAEQLFSPLKDSDLPDDFNELSAKSKVLLYSFKSVSDTAVDLAGTIKDKVIDTRKNLWKNGKAIVEDMATYNLSSSNRYNSSAWDLAEQTGLTGANLYGLQQALNKQGFGSYEDYLNNQYRLSDSARAEMQEEMSKAATEWNKLNDSGYFKKVQEFDEQWADFKRDLQYAFIDFFIGNKDIIEGVLQTAIDVLPSILSAINAIVGFFSTSANYSGVSSGAISDIINNYSGGKTTNNSVVFNTNVNSTAGTTDVDTWQRVQSQMFNQYIRNMG